jgi:RNA polymerase sigma-70 factor, ECF subfamily
VHDVEVTRDATHAIELLYREHGARMWRGLLAFSGDPEVASDAVAEAFAQALHRGDAIRDPRAWVWRAAFQIAKGDLRDRRRVGPLTGEALGSYEMEEPDLVLLSALGKLGEKPRAAIVMHHASGYPVGEIAATLGVSPAAVKMHLLRARRRLRALLEDADA